MCIAEGTILYHESQGTKSSLYRKNIQRLTKTFLTLSLSDIARRVHLHAPQEAEQYVRNTIEDGEIHATISKQNGMVHFHDNPEKYDNPAVLRHVEQQMQHCISLDEKLKSMDQEIAVNPQYVQKITRLCGAYHSVVTLWYTMWFIPQCGPHVILGHVVLNAVVYYVGDTTSWATCGNAVVYYVVDTTVWAICDFGTCGNAVVYYVVDTTVWATCDFGTYGNAVVYYVVGTTVWATCDFGTCGNAVVYYVVDTTVWATCDFGTCGNTVVSTT
eukprot:XP_011670445.1 PREDICTED: uncharacterized protein LOC105441226 [Strongylocentrotus purpuratus]